MPIEGGFGLIANRIGKSYSDIFLISFAFINIETPLVVLKINSELFIKDFRSISWFALIIFLIEGNVSFKKVYAVCSNVLIFIKNGGAIGSSSSLVWSNIKSFDKSSF